MSAANEPKVRRRTGTMVSLSAVTWDFALVGRTRMLTDEWLRSGQPTTFVQVPSYRTALERLTAGFRTPPPAHVVHPWPACPARLWPLMSNGLLRRTIRSRARELRRQLDRRIDWPDSTALVVSPIWAPWLDDLPFGKIVYDCIDDVSVHAPTRRLATLCRRWEGELLEKASGAVATVEPLRADLRRRRPTLPVALIRNGVDAEAFQRRARSLPRPADLPPSGRPLIGFVGALYEWIDWELIAAVVASLPQCDFVFVGPHNRAAAIEKLKRRSNVWFLGPRPYPAVPAYVQAFDVCWVPFDQSRISQTANPVKIYEYLALGKPVVTTPVADTDSFGDHVLVGRAPEEVAAHLRTALAGGDQHSAERVRFARSNSWAARAAEYASFVDSLAE